MMGRRNLSHILLILIIIILLLLMPCASRAAAVGDVPPRTKEGTEKECDLLRSNRSQAGRCQEACPRSFAKHLQVRYTRSNRGARGTAIYYCTRPAVPAAATPHHGLRSREASKLGRRLI
ncbi:hypothetical protein MAPG_03615 [Magnaporthiopsis poae ATCC 64411]|uniref:Secreted protein n=1 Tax=Magnaporthiopsis poae (strain ATCC 64411 / 73-15) TaxID=644358 RepID=A0A0C4DUH6_MAGP6|nr:hypothetical protein MAPG_03615 [Magnaporthiopsis poae ATCC 64411]